MWTIIGFGAVCAIVVGVALWVELRLAKYDDAIYPIHPNGVRKYDN